MGAVRALLSLLTILALAGSSLAQACDLAVVPLADASGLRSEFKTSLIEPGEYQRKLLGETAGHMPPLLCAGVRDVAFVTAEPTREGGAVLGWVYSNHSQSTLYINSLPNRASEADLRPSPTNRIVGNVWATTLETLLHESTHAAVHLLNTQVIEGDCTLWYFFCDEPTDASQWPAWSVALARAAAERVRLRVSFEAEWNRLHRSFVDVGLAQPYGPKLPASEVARAGFMTPYGGTDPSEDIADVVAQVQASGIQGFDVIDADVNRMERADQGCLAFESVSDGLPGNLAALYTKIMLLRDVGLVSPEAAAACLGKAGFNTRDTEGLHFFTQDSEYRRTFTDGLSAGIGRTSEGDRFKFQLSAKGTLPVDGVEHAATFLLNLDLGPTSESLDRVSWPRGIYPLELLGDNRLIVAVPDMNHVTYHVDSGFVLISTATNDRIEGAIIMNRATRPFAPMMVPMAAADLPRINFRIDSSSR